MIHISRGIQTWSGTAGTKKGTVIKWMRISTMCEHQRVSNMKKHQAKNTWILTKQSYKINRICGMKNP